MYNYRFSQYGLLVLPQCTHITHTDTSNPLKFLCYIILLNSYLLKDAGYQFMINREPRSFQGTVAFLCRDNLGFQFIGGFKEGL